MSKEKPQIDKIQTSFPIEDDLRCSVYGKDFDKMQESEIKYEMCSLDQENSTARIWLKNGAYIEYELIEENTVRERTRRADDESIWASNDIDLSHGGHEDFIVCVENLIEIYLQQQRQTKEDFSNWESIQAII